MQVCSLLKLYWALWGADNQVASLVLCSVRGPDTALRAACQIELEPGCFYTLASTLGSSMVYNVVYGREYVWFMVYNSWMFFTDSRVRLKAFWAPLKGFRLELIFTRTICFFYRLGVLFVGVLTTRALQFGSIWGAMKLPPSKRAEVMQEADLEVVEQLQCFSPSMYRLDICSMDTVACTA